MACWGQASVQAHSSVSRDVELIRKNAQQRFGLISRAIYPGRALEENPELLNTEVELLMP